MRKNLLLASATFACLVGSVAMVGSSCSGKTPNKKSGGNMPVLEASDPIYLSGGRIESWRDSIAGNPATCDGGGFWDSTYSNTGNYRIGSFWLTHNAGFNVYSYWGGFTTGSNGDTRCYTTNCTTALAPCAGSGSNAWVTNQWGVMAGGGLDASYKTENGLPYFIAYWDYYSETGGTHSLEVRLNSDSLFAPQEVYICNHPWPYYGNLYGDGFTKPLADTGFFNLIITGYDDYNSETGTYIDTLAKGSKTGVIQSDKWHKVSLASFGQYTQKLVFTMYSTDSDPQWGPNTAVYFCLDKLKIKKTEDATRTPAPAAAARQVKAKAVAPKMVEVTDAFPLTSYTGGEVTVHNATTGEIVHKTTVKAGERPNLSKLPEGEYRLRHGHKYIPIKKVKK
jgi:hypothetical protein